MTTEAAGGWARGSVSSDPTNTTLSQLTTAHHLQIAIDAVMMLAAWALNPEQKNISMLQKNNLAEVRLELSIFSYLRWIPPWRSRQDSWRY